MDKFDEYELTDEHLKVLKDAGYLYIQIEEHRYVKLTYKE